MMERAAVQRNFTVLAVAASRRMARTGFRDMNYYQEQATIIRQHAARLKFHEIREKLLDVAEKYDELVRLTEARLRARRPP